MPVHLIMPGETDRQERTGFQIPFKACLWWPKLPPFWLHLLKVPPPLSNSASLGIIKPLTHGPLGDIPDPNYSTRCALKTANTTSTARYIVVYIATIMQRFLCSIYQGKELLTCDPYTYLILLNITRLYSRNGCPGYAPTNSVLGFPFP